MARLALVGRTRGGQEPGEWSSQPAPGSLCLWCGWLRAGGPAVSTSAEAGCLTAHGPSVTACVGNGLDRPGVEACSPALGKSGLLSSSPWRRAGGWPGGRPGAVARVEASGWGGCLQQPLSWHWLHCSKRSLTQWRTQLMPAVTELHSGHGASLLGANSCSITRPGRASAVGCL